MFESKISAGAREELPYCEKHAANISSWSHDGRSCKEMRGKMLRTGEQNNSTTIQRRNTMPWRPPIQGRRNGICRRIVKSMLSNCPDMLVLGTNWKTKNLTNDWIGWYLTSITHVNTNNFVMWVILQNNADWDCFRIVRKCLYLGRIGRPDISWSVNKLARAVTTWTKVCDRRLARLISYIHHTNGHRQYCQVGNTAQRCRLGLFQDSDFAGDLEDSKSTSGRVLCVFGSHTFVPISWMCKKQTSVSRSSTESEIISLDAGLRLDGIPALDLWDLVKEVFHSSPNQTNKTKDVREPRGNLSANPQLNIR